MIATTNSESWYASRSHNVALTPSTTIEAARTAASLAGGSSERSTPAAASGNTQRYAAAGANHRQAAASAIQIGSVTLQASAGCRAGWLLAGSHRPALAIAQPAVVPV